MSARSDSRRHRIDVTARVVAAIFAGYAISYLFAGALPLWLPIARTEAILWASLASFVIYAYIVLYAFGVRSAWILWRNLTLVILLLLAAVWWGR